MGKVPKFLQTGSGEEQKGQLLLQTPQNTPTEVQLDSNVLCFYFFFGEDSKVFYIEFNLSSQSMHWTAL